MSKRFIKKFKLQDQVKHMANKDVLLDVSPAGSRIASVHLTRKK